MIRRKLLALLAPLGLSVALGTSCGSDESDDGGGKGARAGSDGESGEGGMPGLGGASGSSVGGNAGNAGTSRGGSGGDASGGQAGAGSGGDGGTSGDAGGPGTGGAGGEAGAPTNQLVVRVYDEDTDMPQAGVAVVLQSSTGSVLDEATTNASGEARFDPPPTSMVTILRDTQSGVALDTVVGTEPGDVIVLGTPVPAVEPTVQVRVSYPGPYAGADGYFTNLGCSGDFGVVNPASIVTRDLSSRCLGADNDFSGLSVARQGSTPLAFSGVKNVPLASGMPTPLTIPAWTPPESFTIGFGNLTSEITDTQFDVRAELDGLVLQTFIGQTSPVTVPSRTLVDGWYVRATAASVVGSDSRTWARRQVLPASTPSPLTLDFADFGPRFDTVNVDATDAIRPTLTWTSSAPTTSLGAVVIRVVWQDLSTQPNSYHVWTIVLPPGTTSTVMPSLPASATLYRPSATADYTVLQVFGLWYEDQADYAAFRNRQPFALGTPFVSPRSEEARFLLYQKSL